MTSGYYPIPNGVSNGPYPWLFEKEWHMMQNTMAGNNLHVTVGSPGTGKTYQQLYKAERLRFDRHGEERLFNPDYLWEHLSWGANDLAIIIDALSKQPHRHTRGYQLIVDEGQLALFSKDAMKTEVKDLAKILMTVRSKRWGIQINLPSFGMLSKDIRSIVNSAIVMRGIPTNYSFGSYYTLEQNPFDGLVYWKKPVFYRVHKTICGIPMVEKKVGGVLTWPRPSRKCCRIYEKLKQEHQNRLYADFKDKIVEGNMTLAEKEKLDAQKVFEAATIIADNPKPFLGAKKRLIMRRVKEYLGLNKKGQKKVLYNVLIEAQRLIDENGKELTNSNGSGKAGSDGLIRTTADNIQSRQRVWVPDWVPQRLVNQMAKQNKEEQKEVEK